MAPDARAASHILAGMVPRLHQWPDIIDSSQSIMSACCFNH